MKRYLIIIVVMLAGQGYSNTWAANARSIMQQVIDRDDGRTQYSHQVVATCRYAKKGKGIACAEKPRIKVMESVQKDYGLKGKDSRSVSIILEPAADRGIGFLQYDYDDPERESDQWMYLSAMGKVKRIVSGRKDEPKTGTLFGSEFSYEDVERRHLSDFTYKLVKEESYQGRPCWVIESRPTPKHARKSNYSRAVQWIDKERLIVLKALMYDRRGRPYKQMSASDVIKKNGVWIALKMNMNNVQNRRITTMKFDRVVINVNIDDALLKQRALTDSAYREKHLRALRNTIK